MRACADVIADLSVEQRGVVCWPLCDTQTRLTQKLIDRFGVDAGEEFAFGVSPGIFAGTGNVERAGGDQCQQHVLIDWHFVFLVVVLFVILAKPVRETIVDRLDGFANFAAGKCRASAARIVGDDQRKALIFGTSPQCGFAQSRMTDHSHTVGVNPGVAFKIVHCPAQAPGPGSHGSPFIGSGAILPTLIEEWLNAILKKTDLEQEQEAKEEQNRLCWEKLNKEIEEKFKKTHAQSQG